jgi:hypothetical protein
MHDLHTHIILKNNVLKVTLDIVENVFFFPRTSSCMRINYKFIYNLRIVGSETFHVLLENPSFENLIKASWNSILVDAHAIVS